MLGYKLLQKADGHPGCTASQRMLVFCKPACKPQLQDGWLATKPVTAIDSLIMMVSHQSSTHHLRCPTHMTLFRSLMVLTMLQNFFDTAIMSQPGGSQLSFMLDSVCLPVQTHVVDCHRKWNRSWGRSVHIRLLQLQTVHALIPATETTARVFFPALLVLQGLLIEHGVFIQC